MGKKASKKQIAKFSEGFAAKLQKTIEKHNKRQVESYLMFKKEQARQGKKGDEPISLMDMIK